MDTPEKPRWYCPTPGWLVLGSLLLTGLIWLSNWLGWPAWHKGYAVLAAIAGVGVVLLAMLLWFVGALLLRWRFQFGIRSLLVLVVVAALPFSWLAAEMKKAREQSKAIGAIKKLGGGVLLSEPGPIWLRRSLGDDLFRTADNVAFGEFMSDEVTEVTDSAVGYLHELNQLASLDLSNTTIKDSQLKHLEGLGYLIHLELNETKVTNAGLEYLEGLKQLRELRLSKTNVTDAGLEHLKRLPNLESLELDDTKVTDAGLKNLAGLGHLLQLELAETNVTDAGLENLRGLKQLEELSLWGTHITDAGLEHLKRAEATAMVGSWCVRLQLKTINPQKG